MAHSNWNHASNQNSRSTISSIWPFEKLLFIRSDGPASVHMKTIRLNYWTVLRVFVQMADGHTHTYIYSWQPRDLIYSSVMHIEFHVLITHGCHHQSNTNRKNKKRDEEEKKITRNEMKWNETNQNRSDKIPFEILGNRTIDYYYRSLHIRTHSMLSLFIIFFFFVHLYLLTLIGMNCAYFRLRPAYLHWVLWTRKNIIETMNQPFRVDRTINKRTDNYKWKTRVLRQSFTHAHSAQKFYLLWFIDNSWMETEWVNSQHQLPLE